MPIALVLPYFLAGQASCSVPRRWIHDGEAEVICDCVFCQGDGDGAWGDLVQWRVAQEEMKLRRYIP